jgi:hypothetical protein
MAEGQNIEQRTSNAEHRMPDGHRPSPSIGVRLIERGVSGFWDLMGVDEIINESDLALNEGRFMRKFEGFM